MKKVKTPLIVLLCVVIVFASIYVMSDIINSFKPFSIYDNFDSTEDISYNIDPIQGKDYLSKNINIGRKTLFVYATLSRGTGENGEDEYIIIDGYVNGVHKDRYNIKAVSPEEDKNVLSQKYGNWFATSESIDKGKKHYGTLYTGTVPNTCKSLEVNNQKASLVKQQFNLNGKNASFYLFYCVDANPDNLDNPVKITYINNKGEKYQEIYDNNGTSRKVEKIN